MQNHVFFISDRLLPVQFPLTYDSNLIEREGKRLGKTLQL